MPEFSSAQEFKLHVHKCFGRIFELLMKMDNVIKEKAEEDAQQGKYAEWADLQDWIEEVMLQSHLAWQYHRLSKGSGRMNTWEQVNNDKSQTEETK